MVEEFSAGCVIKNKNVLYLAVRSRDGFWGFPKGHLEDGESNEDAAVREVREEVGIEVKLLPFSRTIEYGVASGRKQVVFFLAEAVSEQIRLNNEMSSFRWLPRDEVVKLFTKSEVGNKLASVFLDLTSH